MKISVVHGLWNVADRLRSGENLRLMCWCEPKRCHGVAVAAQLRQMAWQPVEVVPDTTGASL